MADLDNEMVSVALTSTGVTTSAQSWTTHVSMWYGTEKLTLESLTVSTPAGFTASTSKATGAVAISVAAGKSVPEQNTVTITLAAMKNGQLYTRELTFKITGVRGGADGSDAVIYSLVTSATMVSKNKNGGYSVASVSCRRMKTVGAVTTATTDGELKYSRDGAAEVPIGDGVGVASGNFTSSLKFVFYVNGQAVDVETVPMVVDGSDGKDGESITAAGHWESANTPYAKNSTVSFAGGSYLSKVETSNPPIKIAKFRNGRLRRKRDGGYILAGRSANRTVHADWQEMVAPRRTVGILLAGQSCQRDQLHFNRHAIPVWIPCHLQTECGRQCKHVQHALSGCTQIQRKLAGSCRCDTEQPDIRTCDSRIHPVCRPGL